MQTQNYSSSKKNIIKMALYFKNMLQYAEYNFFLFLFIPDFPSVQQRLSVCLGVYVWLG